MINIKTTNIDLNNTITEYINKKLLNITNKFSSGVGSTCYVEVAKTTNHHKQGEVFKAEINIILNGDNYFISSEKDDLYKAIDDASDLIVRKINETKDRKKTLFKRGAASVKKMIKGISKRNPFTSKY